MPKLPPPAQPVIVVCTNHLSPQQAEAAWNTLVRDILLPRAIQSVISSTDPGVRHSPPT